MRVYCIYFLINLFNLYIYIDTFLSGIRKGGTTHAVSVGEVDSILPSSCLWDPDIQPCASATVSRPEAYVLVTL